MLSTPFVSAEPAVTQPAPDELLSPGSLLAQCARPLDVGHAGTLARTETTGKEGLNARFHLPDESVGGSPSPRPSPPEERESHLRRLGAGAVAGVLHGHSAE